MIILTVSHLLVSLLILVQILQWDGRNVDIVDHRSLFPGRRLLIIHHTKVSSISMRTIVRLHHDIWIRVIGYLFAILTNKLIFQFK